MNRTFLFSSIFYSMVYMSNTVYSSYLGLYFSETGLGKAQIGIISTIAALVMLVSQPVWGSLGDRTKNKNILLKTILFVTACGIWLFPLAGNNFWLIVAVSAFFSFFNNPVPPMGDTIALELAKRENFRFSTVRTMGSMGFALMSVIAGYILGFGIFLLFPLFSVLRMSGFGASFLLPAVKGSAHNKKSSPGFFELFKDRTLVIYYLYVFLLSTTWAFFSSFNVIFAAEKGLGTDLIGLGVMIGSLSQFPFMFYFDRFYKWLGIKKILLIAGLMYALRWFLYAFALTPQTFLFLWAIHGLNYIVVYLALAEYVSSTVPKELQTRGQMMNSLTLFGISSLFGNFFGGMVAENLGLATGFFLSALICLGGLAFLLVALKQAKSLKTEVFSENP